MVERCEPPEDLRGVDGWHWATNPSGHVVPIKWGLDRKWWLCYSSETPIGLYACGWRYLMPCPTPSGLAAAKEREAALVAAMEKAADLFQWYADEHTAAGKAEKAIRNQNAADDLRAAIKGVRP